MLSLNVRPPQLSLKCLHNNECGVFSGHIKQLFNRTDDLAESEFKIYLFELNGAYEQVDVELSTQTHE